MTEVVGILIFSCLAAMFAFGSAVLPNDRHIECRPTKNFAKETDRDKHPSQDNDDRCTARKKREHKIRQMCKTYVQTRTQAYGQAELTADACFNSLKLRPEYETLFEASLSDVELYTGVVNLLSSIAQDELLSA